nr:hypothetical protein [Pandoravirus massiliensis]
MHAPSDCDTAPHDGVYRLVKTLATLTRLRIDSADPTDHQDTADEAPRAADDDVARAICSRFPGAQHVCKDWQACVREYTIDECDTHGLSLCTRAIDMLGVTVNDVRIVDRPFDLEHAPLNLDIFGHVTHRCRNGQVDVPVWDNIDDHAMSPHLSRRRQLLLSCSRALPKVGRRDDAISDGTNSARAQPQSATNDCHRLVVEVRIGLGRRPWATAGDVVHLGTGTVVKLGCTLVCHSTLVVHSKVRSDTMLGQRSLLTDFLRTSTDGTWATFASRRYANLQRLPEALVARGWRVRDDPRRPWLWGPSTLPHIEKDQRGPTLWIKRHGLPGRLALAFNSARLVSMLSGDTLLDETGFDWPTFFASDPITLAVYGEFSLSPLHQCDPLCINNDHRGCVVALQREKLVGMGLVSPLIVSARDGYFHDAAGSAPDQIMARRIPFPAQRVFTDTDPDTLAGAIDDHVTRSISREYGPVDPQTGLRCHGSLCDDLTKEAILSGRLWAGLAHIDGVHFTTSEGVVDLPSGDQLADPLAHPRLIVNWRSKYTPMRNTKRFRMTVWAIAVAQTDGCGGACVAVRLSKGATNRVRKARDGHLWRSLVGLCVRGDPDYPPDLHPAVSVAVDLERSCAKRGCVVPWAYHTGGPDGRSANARSLAAWVLDRVTDIFAALDAELSHLVAHAERNLAAANNHNDKSII